MKASALTATYRNRRRTDDMNTANWIPDLFMKRVKTNGQWTLFSPNNTPDLHDLYGKAFEQRYEEYERLADEGKIKLFKRVEASALWRKMLTMLFETGHPWITFKDPSNIRSPQHHVGVVHSSNLCTEILLNTSADETAVCNLGSINLAAHVVDGRIDDDLLRDGASERPLFVTKEFTLDQSRRDCRAVNFDKSFIDAIRIAMNLERDQLLTRPALSRDQNGRRRSCDLVDDLEDFLHLSA